VISYRIQRGRLRGGYDTVYRTTSEKAAWRAYFETHITEGEKKRIQERIGKTGNWKDKAMPERKFWT
jgi:hypothetical protein